MKRRLFGIVGALVLAVAGTFVLVSYVNGAEDRALEGEKTVKVLVAAEPIEAGTAAEELEGKLKFERVPQKVKADGAVTSIGSLGKRVTDTDLMPGEQIIDARFVKAGDAEANGSSGSDDGLLQTTVALDPERVLGGRVRAGDTVAVVGSFDPFDTPDGAKTPNQTHILAHKVQVTNVQVNTQDSGPEVEEASDDDESAEVPAPSGQLLVSIAVSAPDLERVVFAAEFGHIWLAAEPNGTDESGTRIVVLDNVWS